MKNKVVNIIGGGYAGGEAALTLSGYGVEVHLFDIFSPFESQIKVDENTKRLFKELQALNSASCALVDDNLIDLRQKMREKLENDPNIMLFDGKIGEISLSEPTIIATGSNTSDAFFQQIESIVGKGRAYRWQPIFPIFENLDLFKQNDLYYLPVKDEEIKQAQQFLKHFDSDEDCIEKWAYCGCELLKAKVFKPVFIDGKILHACLKFKKTEEGFVLQNFQTKLSQENQKRLFEIFSGLKDAKVVKYGDMKKCTFIAPASCVNVHLQSQNNQNLFFAGRLILVGGELEALVTGHLAALNVLNLIEGRGLVKYPTNTICGNIIDNLFTLQGFKQEQIDLNCDIIKGVNEIDAIKKLKKFKEDFDARVSWHNHLCSQKRW